jgi:hypothetical protein
MLEQLKAGDWDKVFEYCGEEERTESYRSRDGSPNVSAVIGHECPVDGFTREDVAEIFAISEGAHDEANWLLFCRLKDGRFAFVSAGCDYTGWDCQAGGYAIVGPDRETMIRLAIGKPDLVRLGLAEERRAK